MKLALHIGTPKTGTTSLQRFCAQNRDALNGQGFRYANSPGAENHRKLMVYARDSEKVDDSFASFGIQNTDDHEAFRTSFAAELAREVAEQSGAHTFLMSSEHIFSKINTVDMAKRLLDLLAPLFSDIKIYLHLRPQLDLMMENASQLVRNGRQMSRSEITRPGVGPQNFFYGYDRFVRNWEDVFGATQIRLVPFRRHPDITEFMISELGIDASDLSPAPPENSPLDWRAIALANVVNRSMLAAKIPRINYFLDSMPGSDRLQPGHALGQEVQARFTTSNAALVGRRQDITLEDLTPNWDEYSEEGNLQLLDAPCAFEPQIGHLLRRFSEELALERWRRHIAEGLTAALSGDDAARRTAERKAREAAAELARIGVVVSEDISVSAN